MTRKLCKFLIFGLVLTMGVCYFNDANAESDVATGGDAQSGGAGAAVNLNFEIVIPQFIYFRVGNPGGTDTIRFEPTVDNISNEDTIDAFSGGDTGTAGLVNVVVKSNAGAIRITEDNNGGGAGLLGPSGSISYSQITTTDEGGGGITPPALTDAGAGFSDVALTTGNVTNRSTTWRYRYTNPAIPPASGTYTGQVTYTAVIP